MLYQHTANSNKYFNIQRYNYTFKEATRKVSDNDVCIYLLSHDLTRHVIYLHAMQPLFTLKHV